ncbi:hypothetical protein BV913_03615 [Neisseria dumasiana]|uniref:Transposase n=1 Tax=Neisseria dumasiana TaxID=1931275 RepID=A0ABX3WMS3_9NEIS|nr:hypothetical protein BV913_03615 [Neisseria dumasiana]
MRLFKKGALCPFSRNRPSENASNTTFSDGLTKIHKHHKPCLSQFLGDSKWQKLLQKWLPTCVPLPVWA